jgi:HK97 family phage prohead protease
VKLEYRSVPLVDVKASGEPGQFSGRASVYGVVDSYGDVVMPGAFTKTLQKSNNRIKVLAQHNPDDVIGLATLEDSADALMASGSLVLELQSAKDMYTRLTNGLIDGISIGYVTENASLDKNGLRQLNEISLWEISLVTFPANDFARVTDVKSAANPFDVVEAFTVTLKRFDAMLAEFKAGAQFSSANAAKIKAAHDAVATAHESLKSLVDMIDSGDDEKAAEKVKSEKAETLALCHAASEALGNLLK